MSRKLPRSFFWMDQQLIRSGVWLKLSAQARLAYMALAASCDREGVSIWSRPKLMELSACTTPEDWDGSLGELTIQRLIEPLPASSPPAIRLIELTGESLMAGTENRQAQNTPSVVLPSSWPFVVHTQTTISLGTPPREGKQAHADPRNSD